MCTLRPITSRKELQAYHRFRYEIYAHSKQHAFLSGPDGCDMDEFDASALHLGWYEGDRLVGCVRLLKPIKCRHPLHLSKDLTGERAHLADELLRQALQDGQPLTEVSRLCIAPERRSLESTRRFVMATIAAAHRFGHDHCLFTCEDRHAAFWMRMGFDVIDGFEGYPRARTTRPGYLLRGDYRDLLARHRVELQELGLLMAAGLAA